MSSLAFSRLVKASLEKGISCLKGAREGCLGEGARWMGQRGRGYTFEIDRRGGGRRCRLRAWLGMEVGLKEERYLK